MIVNSFKESWKKKKKKKKKKVNFRTKIFSSDGSQTDT